MMVQVPDVTHGTTCIRYVWLLQVVTTGSRFSIHAATCRLIIICGRSSGQQTDGDKYPAMPLRCLLVAVVDSQDIMSGRSGILLPHTLVTCSRKLSSVVKLESWNLASGSSQSSVSPPPYTTATCSDHKLSVCTSNLTHNMLSNF